MGHPRWWRNIERAFMGRRRGRRPPSPPPKQDMSIPNFPYPKNILNYLISQSALFNITFITPSGETGTVESGDIQPYSYDDIDISDSPEITPARITPKWNTPTPTAFSTTLAPQPTPQPTNPYNPPTSTKVQRYSLPGYMPIIWMSAIRAMEYTNKIGNITTIDEINRVYIDVEKTMKILINRNHLALPSNIAALIYFCTVFTKIFEPFQSNFVYNNLSRVYPNIFVDGISYQRIIIVDIYCKQASKVFNKFESVPNKYIDDTDRVITYAVPEIIKSIMDVLIEKDPIANLSE